jgi:hypothetical protein
VKSFLKQQQAFLNLFEAIFKSTLNNACVKHTFGEALDSVSSKGKKEKSRSTET